MSIKFQVLGKPGKDNALMVWLNSGTKYFRFLFDCGEDLLKEVSQSDIKSIDYLFFSHLHIDHISGFDYFFRRNYDRGSKPVFIFGPNYTIEAIHHRMLGYKWNLVKGLPGEWIVSQIDRKNISSSKFKTSEGFLEEHLTDIKPFNRIIISNEYFEISTAILNHGIPCIAYRLEEKPSLNIKKDKLEKMNLSPGQWLEALKDLNNPDDEIINIDGKKFKIKNLREELLISKEGSSIAYLTDFGFDNKSVESAVQLARQCKTVVCESQYAEEDLELAKKNFHLTSRQSAEIVKKAGAEKLILFHVSERYNTKEEYQRILSQARSVFNETHFPENWLK